jgi:hypothetical protein
MGRLDLTAVQPPTGGGGRVDRDLLDVNLREALQHPRCSAAGCILKGKTLKPVFHLIGSRLWV